MSSTKAIAKRVLPNGIRTFLRRWKKRSVRTTRRVVESMGYVIARKGDYYSPLPSEFVLEKSFSRWNKPSSLYGIKYDIPILKERLKAIIERYYGDFSRLRPYEDNCSVGFGPGYTEIDALVLYAMIRDLKPRRYLEVGSGLSTYYCHLASVRNAKDKHETAITCIEPYPYQRLYSVKNIKVIKSQVQDIPLETFQELQGGDVLFIDSSHIVRIDGDVPYLYLEIIPKLQKSVYIHIHDIPFPYNIPYPPEYWTLIRQEAANEWPMYWNEAMLLQAFLAFNSHFEIYMSCPLIRHFDEAFVRSLIPVYKTISEESNTFSSIWLRRLS